MRNLAGELAAAGRRLRSAPGFTLTAVVTLALGLAANLTVLAWANALVLAPLGGVPRQGELLVVDGVNARGEDVRLSHPDYRDVRERSVLFAGLLASTWQPLNLAAGAEADRGWAELVSANYFDVLRVPPALGRGFRLDEEKTAARVAVISDEFWRRRLGADPSVLGRQVRANGQWLTVVGVTPPGFRGDVVGLGFDLWIPISLQPVLGGVDRLESRGVPWHGCFGRLKPGVTLAQARAELDAIALALAAEHPTTNAGQRFTVTTLADAPWGTTSMMRPVLTVLAPLAGLVLLVACANVANLLVARALDRRQDAAIRLSLGATPGRLLAGWLCEGVYLLLAAAALAAALALAASRLLPALVPPTSFPVTIGSGLGLAFAGQAAALAAGAVALTALVPAWQAVRTSAASVLKEESATVSGGRGRFRAAVVITQVALSQALLIAAALFLRGLHLARNADPGFETRAVLLASIDLAGTPAVERLPTFYEALLSRVESLPGVRAATLGRRVPLSFGGRPLLPLEVDGYTARPDEDMRIASTSVGPRYFEAMGIPLAHGRDLHARDRPGSPAVAVLSAAAVRRYWPGREAEAVGRRLRADGRWVTVVGVSRDVKHRSLTEPATPHLYLPILQWPRPDAIIHVRTAGDPAAVTAGLRQAVREIDPTLPLHDVKTMAQHLGAPVFALRLGTATLTAFGGLALLLAAVGIHAVIARTVAQRTREMGVRLALGASGGDVWWMVLRGGLRPTLAGVAIGTLMGLAAGRAAAGVLAGAGLIDPVALVSVPALVLAAAVVAGAGPARRAARVDPAVALRASW